MYVCMYVCICIHGFWIQTCTRPNGRSWILGYKLPDRRRGSQSVSQLVVQTFFHTRRGSSSTTGWLAAGLRGRSTTCFDCRRPALVHLSEHAAPVCRVVHPSVRPSVGLSVCLSAYPTACLLIRLLVRPSVDRSIDRSACLSASIDPKSKTRRKKADDTRSHVTVTTRRATDRPNKCATVYRFVIRKKGKERKNEVLLLLSSGTQQQVTTTTYSNNHNINDNASGSGFRGFCGSRSLAPTRTPRLAIAVATATAMRRSLVPRASRLISSVGWRSSVAAAAAPLLLPHLARMQSGHLTFFFRRAKSERC